MHLWGSDLPYNDYSSYIRQLYGCRVQKISVDSGSTCPNRDGTVGTGGCSYCSVQSFVPAYCNPSKTISEQVAEGINFFAHKYQGQKYQVYFQAYSGTYRSIDQLRAQYEEAIAIPGVCGLIVATRPDVISDAALALLTELNTRIPVSIELGVETTNDDTLARINRGHRVAHTVEAISRIKAAGLGLGGHLILGLPGETGTDFQAHAVFCNNQPFDTLKIHHLQVLRGTRMETELHEQPNKFNLFTLDSYLETLTDFVESLRPDLVLERFINEAPPSMLIGPLWGGIKNFEFNHRFIKKLNSERRFQSRLYDALSGAS